ncbi:DUF1127 domain-containing protein [Zooshikella harenae]|uniref:DUF1127 domain-containing protein n=1 Tax=Zooshikella harenae TaxID=2827238 RepID=A0ABS5ZAD9_9GAMM|nr:DUF1127 domain-containing protein [Zooshikella harenae]MBU2710718.1 DUF1127 domain-containing protein [Zooshikella harenae]
MIVSKYIYYLTHHIKYWHIRSKTRKQLLQLTTHELKDVGISKKTALTEGNKPFWKT